MAFFARNGIWFAPSTDSSLFSVPSGRAGGAIKACAENDVLVASISCNVSIECAPNATVSLGPPRTTATSPSALEVRESGVSVSAEEGLSIGTLQGDDVFGLKVAGGSSASAPELQVVFSGGGGAATSTAVRRRVVCFTTDTSSLPLRLPTSTVPTHWSV